MPDDAADRKRWAYDVFISHNRADKAWVRSLADRLAEETCNGRHLRPWLDERFLDPGELGSDAELTTALDRSRVFVLVLSPEATASKWVDFEIRHFLATREREAAVPLLLRDCELPAGLDGLPVLDLRDASRREDGLGELAARLCPAAGATPAEVERGVDGAFAAFLADDPGDFHAGPRPERDAFFRELVRHDVDDAASEGLAAAAFARAAGHLLQLAAAGSGHEYNFRMLLGECLAAALHRSTGYRQVAQRYLDLAEARPGGAALRFVVARAYSKLAEVDPRRVDASVLARTASQLDADERPDREARTVVALLARTLGKVRHTPAGELLVKNLSEWGSASRIAAAGAVSLSPDRSAPVFYLSELERRHAARGEAGARPSAPPSRRLLALLYDLTADDDPAVAAAGRLAKQEIERDHPGSDFPYGYGWLDRRPGLVATHLHAAPFAGTVVKATLANMDEVAGGLDVATVACLTGPRVVDALFDGCGALLIPEQDPASHQCRRLRERGVPFGMLDAERMAALSDGDHVVVSPGRVSVLRGKTG